MGKTNKKERFTLFADVKTGFDPLIAMHIGYVNDAELSVLLVHFNDPNTVLAERLHSAYAVLIRCEELLQTKEFNQVEDKFLNDEIQYFTTYLSESLGGITDREQLHALMMQLDEKRHENDFEYLPGKTLDLAQPVISSDEMARLYKYQTTMAAELIKEKHYQIGNKKFSLVDLMRKYNEEPHEKPMNTLRIAAWLRNFQGKVDTDTKDGETKYLLSSLLLNFLYTELDNKLEREGGVVSRIQGIEETDRKGNKQDIAVSLLSEINLAAIEYICKIKEHVAKPEMNTKKALGVNLHSKIHDYMHNSTYYMPQGRDQFRMIVNNGLLQEEKKDADEKRIYTNYSSATAVAHDKKGWVAYTMNMRNEISAFSHHGGEVIEDKVHVHSSMNAGAIVKAAGQMKIEDGKLTDIDDSSGHYRPDAFTVYQLLKCLRDQGLDITTTTVHLNSRSVKKLRKDVDKDLVHPENNTIPAHKLIAVYDKKIIDQHVRHAERIMERVDQYIKDTSRETTHPWFKLIRFKDMIIARILGDEKRHTTVDVLNEAAQTLKDRMIILLNNPNKISNKDVDGLLANTHESLQQISGKCVGTGLPSLIRKTEESLQVLSVSSRSPISGTKS